MTTEEKAKAYDEVLERAKKWYNNPNSSSIGKSYLLAILPELEESEDERIKELIRNLLTIDNPSTKELYSIYGKSKADAIAWLEKQGEQNLANSAKTCKVEQKPAEWSEEDMKMSEEDVKMREAIEYVMTMYENQRLLSQQGIKLVDLLAWLNPIRPPKQ